MSEEIKTAIAYSVAIFAYDCPYCGHEYETMEDPHESEIDCESCEKIFYVEVEGAK